jgi:hypothetical protein
MSSESLVRICETARYYLMGTGSFPNVKCPWCGADHPPPSSAEASDGPELSDRPPSPPALTCYGVNFTFACYHNQEDYDISFHDFGNINSQNAVASGYSDQVNRYTIIRFIKSLAFNTGQMLRIFRSLTSDLPLLLFTVQAAKCLYRPQYFLTTFSSSCSLLLSVNLM